MPHGERVGEEVRDSRRQFLLRAGALTAGGTLAAAGLADPSPEIHWTLSSAFQPALPFLYGGAETFAAALSDTTYGRFTVTVRPAGDIAAAVDTLDAVAAGKAECGKRHLPTRGPRSPLTSSRARGLVYRIEPTEMGGESAVPHG